MVAAEAVTVDLLWFIVLVVLAIIGVVAVLARKFF